MKMPDIVSPTDRPIRTDQVGESFIVHGTYGLVLVNGYRAEHLAAIWKTASPTTVVFIRTDLQVVDPVPQHLCVDRSLLRQSGKAGFTKVDYAGQVAFIELGAGPHGELQWFPLNARWVDAFLTTIDQLDPPRSVEANTAS